MSGDEKEREGLLWNWMLSLFLNAISLVSRTVVREGMSKRNHGMDEVTLENGGLLITKGSTHLLSCE